MFPLIKTFRLGFRYVAILTAFYLCVVNKHVGGVCAE